MPILSQIYVYPVKSLGGFQAAQWPVDRTGLRYDRKWMLVDEHGKFLSQRRLPAMALIRAGVVGDRLVLSAAGYPDLALALDCADGDELAVEIWDDRCLARTVGRQADEWLSRILKCPCRLVYHPDNEVRRVDPDYALETDQTAYSDGFPFLIISEASLTALNTAMRLRMGMIRFRPNLVAAACASYAEDGWRQIEINGIGFRLPKPCSRCSIPTIDPETGLHGKEPLTTLSRLRQWRHKVYFGQNALHDSPGLLIVGSEIHIRRTGENQPPL
ncbi:MAG: MOSC domain-containing protein [Methylococcales bacterium]|nr:MOSC domain-containing protein [Methylococcales bacterium]